MTTPLAKVLLFRSVTYLVRGRPISADHIAAGEGVTLEADDAVDRVLVKVDGKTVYRIAYANVAGDVPATPDADCDRHPDPEKALAANQALLAGEGVLAKVIPKHESFVEPSDDSKPPPERPLSRAERRAQKKG